MHYDIVTWMTFFPCLGALLLLLLPRSYNNWTQMVAFAASLAPGILAATILCFFNPTEGLQFSNRFKWIEAINVSYLIGIDGLSMAMALLVSILTPLAILSACHWVVPNEPLPDPSPIPGKGLHAGPKAFFALILLEQTGLYGAFTALDFFHWFIFWEASLVPMFFLIKLYGDKDATRASYQFFIYTFAGSVMMIIGMQFVYWATGTWDLTQLAHYAHQPGKTGENLLADMIQAKAAQTGIPFLIQHAYTLIFLLVFAGFAVKVPLWPFHSWLPSSYTQAPTAASMLLTGVMSKMGVYGFLRVVLPLFGPPMRDHSHLLLALAVATILFGAMAALAQRDLKTMIAYSSVNHLGYCLLGVFAVAAAAGGANDRAMALNGVIVQMFAHGLSAAGLFYFAGVLEQRTGVRDMREMGGLRKTVPIMCGLMGIVMFASLGLPGLAGFVGEFMIFRGSFPLASGLTSLAALGILITAMYLLRMTGFVFFGPQDEKWNKMPDLNRTEIFVGGLLVALLFWVGVHPDSLVNLSNSAIMELVKF